MVQCVITTRYDNKYVVSARDENDIDAHIDSYDINSSTALAKWDEWGMTRYDWILDDWLQYIRYSSVNTDTE